MAKRYFVEILNRSNDVERRQEVSGFPVRIGRAYDVDVLIDDPFVDPHHLEITQDQEGQLQAKDLGSQNGTSHLVGKKSTRLQGPVALGPDDRLRIGQSMLRIRPDSHVVPAALALPANEKQSPVSLLLAVFAVTLLSQVDDFYRPVDELVERMPGNALIIVSLLAIGSGIMALVGRAFSRRLDFYRHFLILSVSAAAVMLSLLMFDLVTFAFGLDKPVLIQMSVVSLLVAIALHHHLRLFVRVRRAALFGITLSISTALIFSPKILDKLSDSTSRSKDERASQVILPPEFLLTKGASVDDFLAQVDVARASAERLAAEKVKK